VCAHFAIIIVNVNEQMYFTQLCVV